MLHITKSYVRTLLLGAVALLFFGAGTMFAADEKTYATENSRLKNPPGTRFITSIPSAGTIRTPDGAKHVRGRRFCRFRPCG